jgi:hypothetical protein
MSTITSTIEAITANTRRFVEQQTKASTSARNLTWTIMAEVYALGLEAFKPENAVDFGRELRAHGLKPATGDENPWLKVVNVAVGDFEMTGKTGKAKRKWKPNRSFSKYARALRYMESQNVEADDALAYIKATTSHTDAKGEGGKHLIGMIEADKIKYPASTRDFSDPVAVAKAEANPLGIIAMPSDTRPGRHYTRAFGYVENGVFVVIGQLPDSERAAKLDAHKAGKALGAS